MPEPALNDLKEWVNSKGLMDVFMVYAQLLNDLVMSACLEGARHLYPFECAHENCKEKLCPPFGKGFEK